MHNLYTHTLWVSYTGIAYKSKHFNIQICIKKVKCANINFQTALGSRIDPSSFNPICILIRLPGKSGNHMLTFEVVFPFFFLSDLVLGNLISLSTWNSHYFCSRGRFLELRSLNLLFHTLILESFYMSFVNVHSSLVG